MTPLHDPVGRARAAQLYDDHVDDIYRYLARRLGNHIADDVVADVFEQAISQLDRFDARRGNERAWLFGIATNLIRRHWRSEERRLRAWTRASLSPGPSGDPLLDTTNRIVATDDAIDVMARIAQLDEADRDLLFLAVWEECTYAACAESLDIPIGTVRSRLHRIRRQLKSDNAPAPRGGSSNKSASRAGVLATEHPLGSEEPS